MQIKYEWQSNPISIATSIVCIPTIAILYMAGIDVLYINVGSWIGYGMLIAAGILSIYAILQVISGIKVVSTDSTVTNSKSD